MNLTSSSRPVNVCRTRGEQHQPLSMRESTRKAPASVITLIGLAA